MDASLPYKLLHVLDQGVEVAFHSECEEITLHLFSDWVYIYWVTAMYQDLDSVLNVRLKHTYL